jgi:hypothetical protein
LGLSWLVVLVKHRANAAALQLMAKPREMPIRESDIFGHLE